MTLEVSAPLPGRVLAMADVADPVFAQEIVGPGIALVPDDGAGTLDVLAPVDGRLVKVLPHAFVVVTDSEVGVLVHLGLDTVDLHGAGFTVAARQGERVTRGQCVIRWDTSRAREAGLDPTVPVIILEGDPGTLTDLAAPGARVAGGQPLLTVA